MPTDIVVAYDFSPPAHRALELARTLRARLKAGVHVVHVCEVPHGIIAGPAVVPPPPEQLHDIEVSLREKIADVFGPEAQAISSRVLVGVPLDQLLEFVATENANLICIGTTGRTGMERILLGSVAEKIIRKSPVPVLTVH